MKALKDVLQKYERESQKVISSLEKNREENAKKLVKEYVGSSYVTVLDNSTKAQVAFSKNANNLLDIEKKELKQLDDFKTVKKSLIKEKEDLEDKIVILDATAIEEQQYKFDFKNLEDDSKKEIDNLLKEHSQIRDGWEKDLLDLEVRVKDWEKRREKNLIKEKEEREYQHSLKISQIKDTHEEKLNELRREQELKAHSIEKDIALKRKEIEENNKKYNEAKEYIEKYDDNISSKVSKLLKIKLGFIKDNHKNKMESEERNLSSQIDILDLKIESITKNNEEKKEIINELKEKMEVAKTDLNQLIQNTLSLKE